jgi:hypothetical protein
MFEPAVSLREALSNRRLLGNELVGDSWLPWRALLLASMGEQLTADERNVFRKLTQRNHEPRQVVEEMVVVKGRRAGGSSSIGKVLIPYLAGLCKHPALTRGERGILLCVAADQRQADVILDYAEASFRASPLLSQLIEARVQRELRLNNGITVEVRAADFKRLRGLTFIGVVGDETAFWASEGSANPDYDILEAIRPGLGTTNGPLFLISSPYSRKGELWKTYKQNFGANGDPLILVAQGSTRDFNATLAQSVIDRAYERDPASAAAEYGAQFRTDIEALVSPEVVMANVPRGTFERGKEDYQTYYAFVDPSGGSSDSMTLAVAHRDFARNVVVLDCLREMPPPFSPEQTVLEFALTCRNYKISKVEGDRFGGEWPRESFRRHGISYEVCDKTKSELYQALLPLLNSRRIELLDNARLINQLINLERRTSRGGKDSIDHSPGSHDDVSNVCAGVAAMCTRYGGFDTQYSSWQPGFVDYDQREQPQEAAEQERADLIRQYGGTDQWWRAVERPKTFTGSMWD